MYSFHSFTQLFSCFDVSKLVSGPSDTKLGKHRLIKIKAILEEGSHHNNFFSSARGEGCVSLCPVWTGMAFLPARSSVCRMKTPENAWGWTGSKWWETSTREPSGSALPLPARWGAFNTHLSSLSDGKDALQVWDTEWVAHNSRVSRKF